jgi:hypothetical protein
VLWPLQIMSRSIWSLLEIHYLFTCSFGKIQSLELIGNGLMLLLLLKSYDAVD